MAKEIILYNLAEGVSEEAYLDYVAKEKGPFLAGLPSAEKFELIKIVGAAAGESPYQYAGILHLRDLAEFRDRDAPSAAFQEFMKKWRTKVKDFHILAGIEIYQHE
jgi:hypothetical protein